jgi:hypothetical protein
VDARLALGLQDHVATVLGVSPHFRAFFRGEISGLVQHGVRHAHLADVVERCQAGQELDAVWREVVAEQRMPRQFLGEQRA